MKQYFILFLAAALALASCRGRGAAPCGASPCSRSRSSSPSSSAGVNTLSEVLQAHALMLQAENAITDRRTTYVMARRRLLDLRQGRPGAGK
ncbi:MAG: hypothetical protein K6E93_03735 [Bacteroidales bacterium]|nr:hypothetical protein [Bacteroidales bacterium]